MDWIIPDGFRNDFLSRAMLLLCIGLGAAFAHSARAQADVAGESARQPFRVEIDAPGELRALLQRGLDLMRWQRDERVTAESLKRLVGEARFEAERAAAAEGYFSAVVRTSIEPGDRGAIVRIAVDPGARTAVSSVDIQFRGAIADGDPANNKRIAAARRAWRLPPGEPFRQADWESAKKAAIDDAARELYAAASLVKSEARVDPESHSAALRIEIDSGPAFRFGALQVSGTKRYDARIVEHLYPIRPGEPYEASRLAAYQRRLLETGYFATAQVAINRDPAKADAALVQATVVEARSQRIDTGVYASTDTDIGVQFDYTNQDLLDRALRFRTRARWDSTTQLLDTSVDTPPRTGGVWNTLNAKYEATDIQGQRTDGTMVGIAYNWGPETTPSQLSLSAHHERQVVVGSTTERNDAVYAGFRKVFRYTDDPLLPRQGVLGSVHLGSSVPGTSTQDFARATGKVNVLIPFGRRFDISARAEGGIVFADSRFGIPSTFLFRTGGDQTVRGYSYQSIGVPQGAAVVGGRYLAIGSVEGTWWFAGDLGAAAFVDAGDAFDERGDFDPAFGYGVGVRWRSPIGPFRADVAYGVRSQSVRVHFSVGFTF